MQMRPVEGWQLPQRLVMLRYASWPAFTPMMGSHAATSAGTQACTTARHWVTSSFDACDACAMGVADTRSIWASIQSCLRCTKSATSTGDIQTGADASTWSPSRAIRRLRFFTFLRCKRTSMPST